MRTATTLHKTAKGWVMKHDPDVPFAKQKSDFAAAVQGNWPKDVLIIRFQTNNGKEKLLHADKAKGRQAALAQAELIAQAKQLKQTRDAQQARLKAAIAAIEPQIANQKERVEVFKAKAAASKDTKWNQQFLIEHKQATESLSAMEKQHSELKAELSEMDAKAAPAPTPTTATPAA